MKKLSLFFIACLSAFIFCSCDKDDDETITVPVDISLENKLTEENSEFNSEKALIPGNFASDTFQDSDGLLTFDHYFVDWGYGDGYSFAAFTYMNKTDNSAANSPVPYCKKAKSGKVYLAVNPSSFNPAIMTINNPFTYSIKGAWVTNSTYAYNSMTVGNYYATPFKKDSWFKLTATGLDANNKETGTAEIYLANYKSDDDKPVTDWIWFDMTALGKAVKIQFELTSSDIGEYGMNTAAYFCMDDIVLNKTIYK